MKQITKQLMLLALLCMPWATKVQAQCDDGVAQCAITIQMTDSYGDGWNGASIQVYQDTILRGTVTCNGAASEATVNICSDDSVRLVWNSGIYDGETEFTVLNGDLTTVLADQSGSGFSTGSTIVTFMPVCPTCIMPSSLLFSDIDDGSATISWTAGYDESLWELIVGEDTYYATSESYYVSGLDAATTYTVSVRAICTAGDTSVALTGSFRTACPGNTCEVSVFLDNSYSYSFPGVKVWQGGTELAEWQSGGTHSVEVCDEDTVTFTYIAPSWSYGVNTITIYDGGNTQIFTTTSGFGNGDTVFVLDDACPSCIPPANLHAVERTDESITVVWEPRSDESEWLLWLNDSAIGSVSDTFFTFDYLNANTSYTINLQAVCSSDDSSSIVSKTYKTACGEMTIPYTEDWENGPNGGWPDCWDRILSYGTDPSTNAQYNHTPGGNRSMFLLADDDYNMFVSGVVPLPGDAIKVSFWLTMPSYGNTEVLAGVMTNPDDTSTFIPLVTVTGNNTEWTEHEFNTSTLDGNASYYVAFRYYGEYSYYSGAIDDIYISEYSQCDRPSAATVVDVEEYSATLSWNSVGVASGYWVYYSTTNNIDDATSVFANDTAIQLTGLLPQTTYYAWIATACGSDISGDNRPTGAFTTLTTCAPVTDVMLENAGYTAAQISWSYDYTIGFAPDGVQITLVDNIDTNVAPIVSYVTGNIATFTGLVAGHSYTASIRTMCQTIYQTDTAEVVVFEFSTNTCSEISGTTAASSSYIPTYTYYGNSYSQAIYLASEFTGIDTINGIAYNITSPNNGNNAARTIDVYMANYDTVAFNGSNFATVTSSMLVASNKVLNSNQSGWQTIVFDSPFVYDGVNNLLVVVNDKTGAYGSSAQFAGFSVSGRGISTYRDGATNQYDPLTMTTGSLRSSIPSIRLMADCQTPSCEAPMLTIGDVDSNSLTANWVAMGEAVNFAITLNGVAQGTTSADSYAFQNLTPNTLYTVGIGAICTSTNDTMWSYRNVKTSCGAMILPYVENFEGDNAGEMASCWNIIHDYTYSDYYGGTSYFPSITNNGINNSKALSFCANGPCMAATAPIPNSGLQGDMYHISFHARLASNSCSATAGVMTDVNYDTTYIQLVNIINDDAWHRYDIYTTSLNPNDIYHFAIRYDGTYSYGANYLLDIDSLNIEFDAGCHYPANLTVTTTTSSATLNWTNDGANANYVVAYRLSNGNTYTYTYAGTSTSTTISNLQSAMSYLFCVGNICSNGDTLWSEISGITDCGLVNLPYFEDFSAYTQDVLPPCWVYNSTGVTHFDGGLFFRSNTGPNYPAVLPQFNNIISKLEIEFKTKLGPVSQGDAILVGVADASGNFIQWLDTLTDPNQSRSSFVWMTYRFDNYSGTGVRIALGRLYSGADWALIDDITVRQIPTCKSAENIVGHNLFDPDSSYFTWTHPDNATNFYVYVDTVTADTTTIPINNLITVTGSSYLIPAGILTGGGKYKFFIRTDCDVTESPWSVATFGAGEFIMSQSGTDTVTSCGLVVYDNGGPIAGYYSQTSSSLVMYPDATGNRLQIYGAYLSLYNDGSSTLTIYDGDNTNGTILYQTSYSGPTTMYDSIVTLPIATSTSGPLTVSFTAGTYVNPGYELYVRCIPMASCDDPTYIQASNLTANEVTLNWYGNAANYNIYYRQYGSSSWSMSSSSSANITLSGLSGATTYEVQIRAICSSTDSSNLSSIFTFTTECSVNNITSTSTLTENFEGNEVPPTCWQLVYGSTANATDNPVIFDAAAAHSGSKGLRFSSANLTANGNYNQTIITPEISCNDSMSVLFYVRASEGNESFRVGYSTTTSDISNFTWMPNTSIGSTWLHNRVDIPSTAKYVAINYFAPAPRHYLYVDSLVIAVNDGTQGCAEPIISSISATASTITVNYMNLGSVQAGIVEGSTWDDATTAENIPNGNSYTFDHLFSDNTPLLDTTTYTIGLRSVCGNDYSEWVTMTVSTRAMACNAPSDVTVDVTGAHNATISWNGNDATAWEVYYSDGNTENTITATTTSVSLSNLTMGTTYTARVRAICGQRYSDWSASVSFVPSDCLVPFSLATRDITSNSATISWAEGNASQWEIAYGSTGNFDIAYATRVTVNTNEYTITGLVSNYNYTWAVRALCSDEQSSGWSALVNFTTLPNSQGIDDGTQAALPTAVIYPNPTSDKTTISINGISGEVHISIVDLNGRTLFTGSLACDSHCQKTVNVDNLSKGTYFVRIVGNDGFDMVRKLVVK